MSAMLQGLSKAAGSRGGHVIGTTKSGKPIYESRHARYASLHVSDKGDIGKDASKVGGSFLHYDAADHAEAASAHFKEAYKVDFGKKESSAEGSEHLRASLAHNRLANNLAAKKSLPRLTLLKAGRGEATAKKFIKDGSSAAGIAHTRSGKSVLAARSAAAPEYTHYTAQDHADAAQAHLMYAAKAKKEGRPQAESLHRLRAMSHSQTVAAMVGPENQYAVTMNARAGIKAHKAKTGAQKKTGEAHAAQAENVAASIANGHASQGLQAYGPALVLNQPEGKKGKR